MASWGLYHIHIVEKIVKKTNSKRNQYDFSQVLSKFSETIFRTILETFSAYHVTIIRGVVYKKSMIFEVFWEYVSKFLVFPHEIFFVARSYRVLVIKSKKSYCGCFSYPGNEAQSPVFGDFWRFWAFFELSVQLNVSTFTCSKKIFHNIKFGARNQYNADQIFVKSALWSGPYKVPFSVLLIRKTWN